MDATEATDRRGAPIQQRRERLQAELNEGEGHKYLRSGEIYLHQARPSKPSLDHPRLLVCRS
jgi:hypothetical protein